MCHCEERKRRGNPQFLHEKERIATPINSARNDIFFYLVKTAHKSKLLFEIFVEINEIVKNCLFFNKMLAKFI